MTSPRLVRRALALLVALASVLPPILAVPTAQAVTVAVTDPAGIAPALEDADAFIDDVHAQQAQGTLSESVATELSAVATAARDALRAASDAAGSGQDAAPQLRAARDAIAEVRRWMVVSRSVPTRIDLDKRLSDIDWQVVSLLSGVSLGNVALQPGAADPLVEATVLVDLTNSGPLSVRADRLVVDLGENGTVGFGAVDGAFELPAAQTVRMRVPVTLNTTKVAGQVPVKVQVSEAGGPFLAQLTTSVPLELAVPPLGAGALDHVDFGDPASEAAHGVQAPSFDDSTGVEAGLTRRYLRWRSTSYSTLMQVPSNGRFVIRDVETFAGPGTKHVMVYAAGHLVADLHLTRTESGPGTVVHDVLVTDAMPSPATGKVRIRLSRPADAVDDADTPSSADLWTLPAPTGEVLDHVDFGDQASEAAHSVPSLSTFTVAGYESGLTRRFVQWLDGALAADVQVDPGQPFVIRDLETFPGPLTKDLVFLVDDVRLPRVRLQDSATNPGTASVDVLVTDPQALAGTADGHVVIKITSLTPSPFNVSSADLWVRRMP